MPQSDTTEHSRTKEVPWNKNVLTGKYKLAIVLRDFFVFFSLLFIYTSQEDKEENWYIEIKNVLTI